MTFLKVFKYNLSPAVLLVIFFVTLLVFSHITFVFTLLVGFDSLVEDKLTFGSLTARQGNGLFIPQMYTKQQSDWVHNFYKQNGYLGKVSYISCIYEYFAELIILK